MNLRLKLVMALVALSALATGAIGLFSYRTTADQLRSQVDRSLISVARSTGDRMVDDGGRNRSERPPGGRPAGLFRPEGGVVGQFITVGGEVYSFSEVTLPADFADRAIASATQPASVFRDVDIDGEPYRVLTTGYGDSRNALQTGRSLSETEELLATLRGRILVAAAVVVLLAVLIGSVIARQISRRLTRLTAAAEQVTATGSLDVEVPVSGTDETGRLGSAFNAMLATLARSQQDQQRLVQDAGHELRTPLTSLRTNVYSLQRAEELTPEQRVQVLGDLEGETEELTRLVNEVVELATDRRSDEAMATLEMAPLLERVAARAAQRSGRVVTLHCDDTVVMAREMAVERAVANLIENALKFDGRDDRNERVFGDGDGGIEVTCDAGRVEVLDRGPGFSDADLPHVFDRFYRSDAARSRPGSGLGLSIVADVAARHGGSVVAGNRTGGGAFVGFQLPTV